MKPFSKTSSLGFLLLFVALTGCGRFMNLQQGTPRGVMCTLNFQYGLAVIVHSASPSSSFNGLKIEVKDGDWTETFEVDSAGDVWATRGAQPRERDYFYLDEDGSISFWAAGERPGTYEVTVTHPTLSTGPKKSATVTRDICHVDTTSVEFELK